MNTCTVIGNLVFDSRLDTRTIAGMDEPVKVFNNRIAVNTRLKNGTIREDFFDFAAWRKLAELCATYCRKGMKVAVRGHVGLKSYNGKTVLQLYEIEEIEFCNKYGYETTITEDGKVITNAPAAEEESAPVAPVDPVAPSVAVAVDDDDLPF